MKKSHFTKTSIKRPTKDLGLSIEETIRRAIATNQPIEGKSPMIYTDAKDGVLPQYDIRTDKQELALKANDRFQGAEFMKGFITATEYDENGFDGKGNKKAEQQQNEE